jgi:hypothetical protein
MLEVTFTTTAYNLTKHTPVTVGFDPDPRAHFFIDTRPRVPHEVTFNVGDQIRVTFVHRATGLEETVVIPVTPEVQLGSITFGEVILPPLRTVLTKDLTNVRIPFTAKDQNGNPMILVDGANVNLYSSDQAVVSNSSLRFAWFAGEQNILIERFLNKGPVIITVMGTPGGVVGNKFLNVEEGLPYQLQVFTEPSTVLRPSLLGVLSGNSTVIRLRVIDQFGRAVNAAAASDEFEIVTIKSSQGNTNLSDPLHNERFTLITAGSPGIRIASGGIEGVNDTITFRLQRKNGTFVDSVSRTIYVMRFYDSLDIQPDQLVFPYQAGDDITLSIKAILNGQIHVEYNDTVRAEITTRRADGTVLDREFKTLVFRNGIADSTSIRAKKAGENLRIFVTIGDEVNLSATTITILPGPPSKFVLAATLGGRDLEIKLADSQDNVINTNETWLLKVFYPEAFIGKASPPLGNNDEFIANFVQGTVTISFNNDLVRGTYRVEDELGEIKGSITLNP